MLDEGAEPTMGIRLPVGVTRQVGQCARSDRSRVDVGGKLYTTFAEIMPATNVPCPLFALLLNPRPSPTKSSPPITEPSRLICGKFGRIPESMTATFIPCPENPCAKAGPRFMNVLLMRYASGLAAAA